MPVPLPWRPTPVASIEHPHPLDLLDRPVIEALAGVSAPSESDIVNASRLYIRYRDSRLSPDLAETILQALKAWNLSVEELQERARAIWQSGWRPSVPDAEEQPVGSGADVEG
jgi:hypothetical protein